jgi:DNA repair protein RadA/Sms
MKTKTAWVCVECGSKQAKWSGSCFACKQWDTLQEHTMMEEKKAKFESKANTVSKPIALDLVDTKEYMRFQTGFSEVDRLLGGGVVDGSLTLIGGDPGIGKSTLMMQLTNFFSKQGKKILYVCGEESVHQTHLRAKRLNIHSQSILLLNETIFSQIRMYLDELKPDVFILDSIQIVYKNEIPSLPGSVTQIKEIAMECMHIAKGMGITTFVIGHVTKSGELAGPRVLEHIVDTVLEFEGDRQHGYRMLRSMKNRFGPTDEVALFQMFADGLKEVKHPSEMFLEERVKGASGSVIVPTMEGSRAILIEIQALVAQSAFATCTRRSTGVDQNRLALLLAVLEKKMGYHLHSLDVFVSIAGGLKIIEPAIDLPVLIAIASSFANQSIDPLTLIVGEVGLAGEVRSVPRIESRLKEAVHMGFKRCILPKKNCKGLNLKELPIEIVGVESVDEVITKVFL